MSLPGSSRATILVVEDDLPLARTLIDALELAGYRVRHALDGAAARAQVKRARPDIILLDLILPDVDGLILCYTLRAAADVPILICSGTSRRRDPILALKLGADDFIHKPFDMEDLLARIEVLLRRAPRALRGERPPPAELRVGELLIQPARHRVQLGGAPLALTPTEFRLVTVMAAHPDEVLSRNELAQEVWGLDDPSHGRTIDVHVRRLRSKLQRATTAPGIVSVRGEGYKLSARESSSAA